MITITVTILINIIDTSAPSHLGNCHRSFPPPVLSESAQQLTGESMMGSRP